MDLTWLKTLVHLNPLNLHGIAPSGHLSVLVLPTESISVTLGYHCEASGETSSKQSLKTPDVTKVRHLCTSRHFRHCQWWMMVWQRPRATSRLGSPWSLICKDAFRSDFDILTADALMGANQPYSWSIHPPEPSHHLWWWGFPWTLGHWWTRYAIQNALYWTLYLCLGLSRQHIQ